MRPQDILMPAAAGLCCKPGGFHIDPVRPVERAVITHGHSDHARAGHGAVLATQETLDMMRLRYGDNFAGSTQADRAMARKIRLGDVKIEIPSRRPCAGLGADRGLLQGHLHRRLRRLQGCPDPTCTPFEVVPCDVFITEATFGLPVFRHGDAADEVRKLLGLGGAVSRAGASGRRLFARQGAARDRAAARGRLRRADLSAWRDGNDHALLPRAAASRSASCASVQRHEEGRSRRHHHAGAADRPTSDIWTRRFPDPVTAFASGWMRVRARARQRGVELPLVISDHADWDGLTATIAATGAGEVWVTHGQEDALVHWCKTRGLAARPLDLVGYGDEEESEVAGRRRGRRGMNRFAELLDRLAYEPGRNNKLRLLTAYFRDTQDPDRGYALAALTGALSFKHAKPGLIRDLITDAHRSRAVRTLL